MLHREGLFKPRTLPLEDALQLVHLYAGSRTGFVKARLYLLTRL
jgi:hypothetical protein